MTFWDSDFTEDARAESLRRFVTASTFASFASTPANRSASSSLDLALALKGAAPFGCGDGRHGAFPRFDVIGRLPEAEKLSRTGRYRVVTTLCFGAPHRTNEGFHRFTQHVFPTFPLTKSPKWQRFQFLTWPGTTLTLGGSKQCEKRMSASPDPNLLLRCAKPSFRSAADGQPAKTKEELENDFPENDLGEAERLASLS